MILGVMVIHNEDLWLDHAIRNIRDFCDEILVIDNGSVDGSIEIAKRYHAQIVDAPDLRYTHDLVTPYIGTDTWVFGVDGDEIYDPVGLRKLRVIINTGWLYNSFQIVGRFLHVTKLADGQATGYMGPPAHAPTKLYNFHKLVAWPSDHEHMLFLAQTRVIKPGITQRDTRYQSLSWNGCPLKCLHVRFLRRSSIEKPETIGARLTGEDVLGHGSRKDRGGSDDRNLWMRYRTGEQITVDTGVFGI